MVRIVRQLSERDTAVVHLVAKFRQLTAEHIRVAFFADLASHTPLDRTLRRLVRSHHLMRLTRLVGGDGGGSGRFVYQLGRAGWRLLDKPGHYWAPRAVNLHTLAIADCFARLKEAEAAGGVKLLCFDTEPDCHTSVGTISLTPDAYVEVGNSATQLKHTYWLEVDQGTEHASQIKEKCERYWQAYQRWTGEYFPRVVFVVPDERRKGSINKVTLRGPQDAQSLTLVMTAQSLDLGQACS